MKPLFKVTLTAGAAIWLLLFTASAAWSHAGLRSSDPAGGAAVEEAPQQVTITFTEPPDAALTSVRVTGAEGSFEDGPPRVVERDNLTVVVDLEPLPNGSYTVSWRTVSQVDGHSTAGAFAFGVGEPPDPATMQLAPEEVGGTNPPAGLARWALYLGLAAMVGAAWMSLFAFNRNPSPPALGRLAVGGWAAALTGLAGLATIQFFDSGVSVAVFVGSSSGQALILRAAPLTLAGLGLLIMRHKHRIAMVVAGVGALATMLAHAAASHAAVAPGAAAKVAVQWIHFAAVGMWIGGLAALLLGIRTAPPKERQRAAKRFSLVAGIAILVVVVTGLLRAVNEVAGWEALFDSNYGRLVLAKSVLLVVIAILGAINRFRNVKVAAESASGLQKTGRAEVVVAIVVFALTGLLSTSVPPVSIADAADDAWVQVEGSNFAGTVEATLTLEPGTAGPNRFTLELVEVNASEPFDATEVVLRLSSLSNPAVGETSIAMEQVDEGRFQATGSNIVADGYWRAIAQISTASDSFDISLGFSTRAVGHFAERTELEGQPTIFMVTDPQGRQFQVYTDPERPGRSELHLTMFDAGGIELALDEIVAIGIPPRGSGTTLVTRRFGPGHFVSDVTLEEGAYRFDVTARTEDGENVRFTAEIEVSS